MAENFVFEAREQVGYNELLPSTTADNVVGTYTKTSLNVVVPATTENVQTIAVPDMTAEMAQMPFEVYLVSGAQDDYGTLTQVESQEGQVVITRLYEMPTAEITIMLLIYSRKELS